MNLKISGVVNDSIVDGAGFRLTVFTQGVPMPVRDATTPRPTTLPADIGQLLQTSVTLRQKILCWMALLCLAANHFYSLPPVANWQKRLTALA